MTGMPKAACWCPPSIAVRRASTVAPALKRHFFSHAKAAGLPIRSIPTDNGKEFAKPAAIAQTLGCGFYFPDPNSPHQRGTSENTNSLLREFFPKNPDLTSLLTTDFDLGSQAN